MNNQQATTIFKIIRKNVNNMFDEVEAELKNQQRIEALANDDDYKMRGIDVQDEKLKEFGAGLESFFNNFLTDKQEAKKQTQSVDRQVVKDLDTILKMKDINDVLDYLFIPSKK